MTDPWGTHMCHTAHLQMPALPLASCARASEGKRDIFLGICLEASAALANYCLGGWKAVGRRGAQCKPGAYRERMSVCVCVCVHTCTVLTRVHSSLFLAGLILHIERSEGVLRFLAGVNL